MNSRGQVIKKIIIALIFMEMAYWICAIITRSSLLSTYFLQDFHDSFMDHFNMFVISADDPYVFKAQYPGMCFLILRVLYHMIPIGSEAIWIDSPGMRQYEPAWWGFILLELFSLGIFIMGCKLLIDKTNRLKESDKHLLLTAIIFSGPVLYSIERGNMILLSAGALGVYLALYDSKSKRERYISYLFLSLSASIKLYPALFGLLTASRIWDKRKIDREAIRETLCLVIIGVLSFVLPFFAYNGFESIKGMLIGMSEASDWMGKLGMNTNFSMYNIAKIGVAIATLGKIKTIENNIIFTLISLAVSGTVWFTSKEIWKKVFAVTIACIWIPTNSYTYVLVFLWFTILIYIAETSKLSPVFLSLMLLCQIPYYLPETGLDAEDVWYKLSYGTVIVNAIVILLVVWVILINIKSMISSRRTERSVRRE